jgi:hypothetical protein
MKQLGQLCCVVIGFAACFVALLALFNDHNSVGAGVCLIAAAIAFGQLSRSSS